MGWNGLDLVSDLSAELGDTSSNFKSKVLRMLNEGIREIATAHQWPCLREKGKQLLVAGEDTYFLPLEKPTAPSAAISTGGFLVADTQYKALITFYESVSGVESIAGDSVTITPTGTDLTIDLTAVPVSVSPLVTARKVYLAKGAAGFVYHGTISDNTTTTYSIGSDTSSPITPPEEDAIFQIDGDMFIEGSRIVTGTSLQNLLYRTNGVFTSGEPQEFAPVNQFEVKFHPNPSTDTTISFYYFKLPARVFGTSTSIPQMPSWIYETLRAYVMWRGYDYRDRAGKESKLINYNENLRLLISRKGRPIKRSGRVRSVTPDSDGYGV